MKMMSFCSVALILAGGVWSSSNFPQNFNVTAGNIGNISMVPFDINMTGVPLASSMPTVEEVQKAFIDDIVNSPVELISTQMQQSYILHLQRRQLYQNQIKALQAAMDMEEKQYSLMFQMVNIGLQKKQAIMEETVLANLANIPGLPVMPLSTGQSSNLPSIQNVSPTFITPAEAKNLLPTQNGAISIASSAPFTVDTTVPLLNDQPVVADDSSPRSKPRTTKRVRFDNGETPKLAKRRTAKAKKEDEVMDIESFIKARPEIGKHALIQHALMQSRNNNNNK